MERGRNAMENKFARGFIVSSFLYLAAGTSLGLMMALTAQRQSWLVPAHVHLNLIGWATGLIAGVTYHIIPRFFGRRLFSVPLGWAHFILVQAGLPGLAVLLPLERLAPGAHPLALALFGGMTYVSFLCYSVNMLGTIWFGKRLGDN